MGHFHGTPLRFHLNILVSCMGINVAHHGHNDHMAAMTIMLGTVTRLVSYKDFVNINV